MRFTELGLSKPIQETISALGYEETTPIQTQAIPPGLQKRDIVGCAQTGTGKTLAFLLPALDRLLRDQTRTKNPRVVVLEPTRELAIQIHKDAMALGKYTDLKLGLAYGGTGYEQQRKTLEEGVDILIGTPGRIIDYFKKRVFDLRALQVMVLDDEAVTPRFVLFRGSGESDFDEVAITGSGGINFTLIKNSRSSIIPMINPYMFD